MKAILIFLCFFVQGAWADQPGACSARDQSNGASEAYCNSFGETACRMNSGTCSWYPQVQSSGVCQPRDESNPSTAAYCESMGRSACLMNTSLCYWL